MWVQWLFDRISSLDRRVAIAEQEPLAKKRKTARSLHRITVDVAGTKFVTSLSTLTEHSTYFSNLLSSTMNDTDNVNGDEIFLDKDPIAFGTLLSYMRDGIIEVDAIDTKVLVLAEFLKMEKLLLAIKVRWYHNIGKGPVLYEDLELEQRDEDIAAAFDHVHGGVSKAITSGLFPFFLSQDDSVAERDYAIMQVCMGGPSVGEVRSFEKWRVNVVEVGKGNIGSSKCVGMIGAINGIYAKGYTLHLEEYANSEWPLSGEESIVFSRLRHSIMRSWATSDILIPNNKEVQARIQAGRYKQFALMIKNELGGTVEIIAPSQFGDNPDPFSHKTIPVEEANDFWLERHGFVNREKDIEDQKSFKTYLSQICDLGEDIRNDCYVYSCNVSHVSKEGGS